MEHSSSFVKHQPFQLHLLHQEFQLDKQLHNGVKRIQDQKEEERVVTKCRPAAMNLSSSIATSSSTASSPIASESPGVPIASVKPDSRMSIESNSVDAASTSQVRLKDAYLGGLMENQRGNPSHQEEEDSEDSDNLEAETWAHEAGMSKRNRSDMGPLPSNIAKHIPFYGSRLLHGQENLWKTTWRSYERFECEFRHLGNVHKYHFSSSGSSRKRLRHEVKICKELSLENIGTAFQRNRKADQWSDRNHLHKPNQFPRFEVRIDKLIAQSSLSIQQMMDHLHVNV